LRDLKKIDYGDPKACRVCRGGHAAFVLDPAAAISKRSAIRGEPRPLGRIRRRSLRTACDTRPA
jgi:hypothetical protein